MQQQTVGRSQGWRLLAALAVLALAFVLVALGSRPPAPKPADAPTNEFSAGRAREILRRLVGDGAPHPVGSPANARVREQVLAELARLGYTPHVQLALACSEQGVCATVKNVVARLDGRESGPAVLLTAHYDSVAAGPGASDDGAGVAAVLEIARVLRQDPPLGYPIIILIDDAEEPGLLGAKAFAAEHPWAREARTVVNVEARGSSGPSLMFETGENNAGLMRLFAKNVKRPATSSLFYIVYKRLPNDTDFSVFRQHGMRGFNFAYIEHVVHYHTPLDNFENANPASLQHNGDNALAVVRALANTDPASLGEGDAVFFDLFGSWTLWWPRGWTLPLAAVAILLLTVAPEQLIQQQRLGLRALLWGFLGWAGMIGLALALALSLRGLLHVAGVDAPWVAEPGALMAAYWAAGFVGVAVVATLLARRAGYWGLCAGGWTWWAILTLVAAMEEPEASFLFIVPTLAAGLAALPAAFSRTENSWKRGIALLVPAFVTASLWLVVAQSLGPTMGLRILPAISVVVAVVATTVAPAMAEVGPRWRLAATATAAVLMLVAAAVALSRPAYTVRAPQRLNLSFHQDSDTGRARWLVYQPSAEKVPETLRAAAPFAGAATGPFPWSTTQAIAADAPALADQAPNLSVVEKTQAGDKWTLRARLVSPRGASTTAVYLPAVAKIQSLAVNGKPVQKYRRLNNGWWIVACLTTPPEGFEVAITFSGNLPPEVFLADRSPGLPPAGDALQKARPSTAVPSQDGDVTIFTRRVPLGGS